MAYRRKLHRCLARALQGCRALPARFPAPFPALLPALFPTLFPALVLALAACLLPASASAQARSGAAAGADRDPNGWSRHYIHPSSRAQTTLAESAADVAYYISPGRIVVLQDQSRLDQSYSLKGSMGLAELSRRDQDVFQRLMGPLTAISGMVFQRFDQQRSPRWLHVDYYVGGKDAIRTGVFTGAYGGRVPVCTILIRGRMDTAGAHVFDFDGQHGASGCNATAGPVAAKPQPTAAEAAAAAASAAAAAARDQQIGSLKLQYERLESQAIEKNRKDLAARHGYVSFDKAWWEQQGEGAEPLRLMFEGELSRSDIDGSFYRPAFLAYTRQWSAACPDLARRNGVKFSEIEITRTYHSVFGYSDRVEQEHTWVEPRFAALFRYYVDPENGRWKKATPLERGMEVFALWQTAVKRPNELRADVERARQLMRATRRLIDEQGCSSPAVRQLAENFERNASDRYSIQAERQGRFGSRLQEAFYTEGGRSYFSTFLLADETARLPAFKVGGKRMTYQDVVRTAVRNKVAVHKEGGWWPIWMMFSDDAGQRYFVTQRSDPISEPDSNERIYVMPVTPEFLKKWDAAMNVRPVSGPGADPSTPIRRGALQAIEAQRTIREARLIRAGGNFLSFGDWADPKNGHADKWPSFQVWLDHVQKNSN